MDELKTQQQKHYVLVHGSCHGAWSWYKLIPLLENAGAGGHRVTAIDLAASGINMKSIYEVNTLQDYAMPLLDLLEALPPEEKVVLVGHSSGGMVVALATERFPHKVEAAVYVAAFMPDTVHEPSYVITQYWSAMLGTEEQMSDTEYTSNGDPDESSVIFTFGPKSLASQLYQRSPQEDLQLALFLRRPSSLFVPDLSKAEKFSDKGYGSVRRIYVTCCHDRIIPPSFQQWMINNGGTAEVKELKDADHMPMFSTLQELCDCLAYIS